jgi:hypothetical protein
MVFPGVAGPDVIIAAVFWNGNGSGIVWDERHGYRRDSD